MYGVTVGKKLPTVFNVNAMSKKFMCISDCDKKCKGKRFHDKRYARQLQIDCMKYTKSEIWKSKDVSDFRHVPES